MGEWGNERSERQPDFDSEWWQVTPKGFQRILGWIRFQVQACQLEHGSDPRTCDDESHVVAHLLLFVVPPIMEGLNVPMNRPIEP